MRQTRHGSCYCGNVQFTVVLRDPPPVRRCNCSLCSARNALMTGVPLADLAVTAGADALVEYQWNTRTARHFFCRHCGVYTHHQRRSDPSEYAVNIACLDNQDFAADTPVEQLTGRSNSLVDDPTR